MQTLSRMPRTPAATERPAFVSSPGLLATADGTLLHGSLRGAPVAAEGDLIFTTAATGWGEILTDPSYEGQIVVLTHPMAGNYRIDPAELESDRVHARALVVTRLVTPPAGDGAVTGGAAGRGRHPGARGHRHPRADAGAAPRRRATGRDPSAPPGRRTRAMPTNAAPSRTPSTARPGSRSTTWQPSRPDRRTSWPPPVSNGAGRC